MANFRIIVKCDPYNAGHHYNGEPVTEYTGATPTAWIIRDGYATEAEAREALWRLAVELYDDIGDWRYFDAEGVEALRAELGATAEMGEDWADWYEGEGIYCEYSPVILRGETSFRDDSMFYTIEEA